MIFLVKRAFVHHKQKRFAQVMFINKFYNLFLENQWVTCMIIISPKFVIVIKYSYPLWAKPIKEDKWFNVININFASKSDQCKNVCGVVVGQILCGCYCVIWYWLFCVECRGTVRGSDIIFLTSFNHSGAATAAPVEKTCKTQIKWHF